MAKMEIVVSQLEKPEASLPSLCRIEHVLKVVPIKRSTVWLWSRQGRFPKPFKHGSITLWRRADIEAWLEQVGEVT